MIRRPKAGKALAKSLPPNGIEALIGVLAAEESSRRSDWTERDRAIILTALLAGLRWMTAPVHGTWARCRQAVHRQFVTVTN
jgi:hypothetical protein